MARDGNGQRGGEIFTQPIEPATGAESELEAAPRDRPVIAIPALGAWLETALAVSAGGLLGANARYAVGLWAAERWGAFFPWGTLLINVSGSFLLGFYLTLVTERFIGRSTTRLFLATGFLGAFTTFSTFNYETLQLVQRGEVGAALAYVGVSLASGLMAVLAGIAAAHAL
jgi:CrcB protein